ncbi:hypothetical protein B0H10DRAFT_2225115 [Mycena sp. CBHHK59/15]|nr:hypothetical protein B0H10DRAFT_2225115 [Mycena sp. CBHHK59/15]
MSRRPKVGESFDFAAGRTATRSSSGKTGKDLNEEPTNEAPRARPARTAKTTAKSKAVWKGAAPTGPKPKDPEYSESGGARKRAASASSAKESSKPKAPRKNPKEPSDHSDDEMDVAVKKNRVTWRVRDSPEEDADTKPQKKSQLLKLMRAPIHLPVIVMTQTPTQRTVTNKTNFRDVAPQLTIASWWDQLNNLDGLLQVDEDLPDDTEDVVDNVVVGAKRKAIAFLTIEQENAEDVAFQGLQPRTP